MGFANAKFLEICQDMLTLDGCWGLILAIAQISTTIQNHRIRQISKSNKYLNTSEYISKPTDDYGAKSKSHPLAFPPRQCSKIQNLHIF